MKIIHGIVRTSKLEAVSCIRISLPCVFLGFMNRLRTSKLMDVAQDSKGDGATLVKIGFDYLLQLRRESRSLQHDVMEMNEKTSFLVRRLAEHCDKCGQVKELFEHDVPETVAVLTGPKESVQPKKMQILEKPKKMQILDHGKKKKCEVDRRKGKEKVKSGKGKKDKNDGVTGKGKGKTKAQTRVL